MSADDVIPKNLDLSKFVGQWVVICNNQLIASDKNLLNLKDKIAKCKKTPTLVQIPDYDTLIV